jgi:hypothetical protein
MRGRGRDSGCSPKSEYRDYLAEVLLCRKLGEDRSSFCAIFWGIGPVSVDINIPGYAIGKYQRHRPGPSRKQISGLSVLGECQKGIGGVFCGKFGFHCLSTKVRRGRSPAESGAAVGFCAGHAEKST